MEIKIKEEEKEGTNHYADSRIKRCQVQSFTYYHVQYNVVTNPKNSNKITSRFIKVIFIHQLRNKTCFPCLYSLVEP